MEAILSIVTIGAVATAIYLAVKIERVSERAMIAEHQLKMASSQIKQLIRIANLRKQPPSSQKVSDNDAA